MRIQEHSTFTFMPIKHLYLYANQAPSNLNIVLPLQDTQYTFKPLFQWRHLFFMNFCVSAWPWVQILLNLSLKYC